MKKMACIILAVLLMMISVPVTAVNDDPATLSEFSDKDFMMFFREWGIGIPEEQNMQQEWIAFVKNIVKTVERFPDAAFPYNNTEILEFANRIKTIVNDYYDVNYTAKDDITSHVGTDGARDGNSFQISVTNILQDNTVDGEWQEEYLNYNCYAYAIFRSNQVNPGFTSQAFDHTASITEIAELVKGDLEHLGWKVLYSGETKPVASSALCKQIICVRKDTDGSFNAAGQRIYDYHFMRQQPNGDWYHKPGNTNPLKYNHSPDNGLIWVSEGKRENYYFRDPSLTYESNIVYITFCMHDYEYRYCHTSNGVHYHINTCTVCGNTKGSRLQCIYAPGSNTCRICGQNKNFIVTSLGREIYQKFKDIA